MPTQTTQLDCDGGGGAMLAGVGGDAGIASPLTASITVSPTSIGRQLPHSIRSRLPGTDLSGGRIAEFFHEFAEEAAPRSRKRAADFEDSAGFSDRDNHLLDCLADGVRLDWIAAWQTV